MRIAIPLLVLLACDAGEKPPPPVTSNPKPIAQPAPPADPIGFSLDYLAIDADLIVHVDFTLLRRSKIWAKHAPDLTKLLMSGLGTCAYDPVATITSATLGVPTESELGVYVLRGIDRDKTLRCLRETKSPKLVFDGDFVTVNTTSGTSAMTFVDATTLVIQGPKGASRVTLAAALQRGAPLGQSQGLRDAVVAARKSGIAEPALIFVSRPGSRTFLEKLASTNLKQLSGTARLTDRFEMRIAMQLPDDEQATQMSSTLEGQAASMKSMFDRFDVSSQGKTVTMDLGMTEAMLDTMINTMRTMMPGD